MKNINDWKTEFYEELSINNNESHDNVCLITKSELIEYSIKLPCNHSFNYLPLYSEICNQKKNPKKQLETQQLHLNEIKCPYCRTTFNKLLPYIPYEGVNKIRGVNTPIKYSMFLSTCKYIMKSGKKKGQLCNKECNFDHCTQHHNIINKHNMIKAQTIGCKHILSRGKNKGKECDRKVKSNDLCTIHCKNTI